MSSALVKQKWTDRHPAMIDCYPRSFVTSPSDWSLNWTMNNEQWTDGKNLQYWNVRDINGAIKAIDMTRLPEFKKTNLPRSCKSIGVEIISCQRKPGVSSLFPIPLIQLCECFTLIYCSLSEALKTLQLYDAQSLEGGEKLLHQSFYLISSCLSTIITTIPSSPPSSPPPPSEWVISQTADFVTLFNNNINTLFLCYYPPSRPHLAVCNWLKVSSKPICRRTPNSKISALSTPSWWGVG